MNSEHNVPFSDKVLGEKEKEIWNLFLAIELLESIGNNVFFIHSTKCKKVGPGDMQFPHRNEAEYFLQTFFTTIFDFLPKVAS